MKVIIFGGTGAMGGYLSEILATPYGSARGIEIHVTTRQDRQSTEGVRYVRGDAHDTEFVRTLLKSEKYDAVIDFMVYSTKEFAVRHELLTGSTGHYIFLSTSRVYADSKSPITEDSPRLLDVSPDKAYLMTDEYALTKARQEDMLRASPAKNWTIIRPYITYSNERLQLGVYEKERWLYRALQGRPVVFSEDIALSTTTLTWGHDVAEGIAGLVGRESAFGETYHITGDESMTWREIAEIYRDVFADVTGCKMTVQYIPRALDDTAQVKYDRLYNRVFDNSKIKSVVPEFRPVSIREGLTRCLSEFVRDKHPFRKIDYRWEAKLDRMTKSSASEFPSRKIMVKYYMWRYCPALGRVLGLGKRILRRLMKYVAH